MNQEVYQAILKRLSVEPDASPKGENKDMSALTEREEDWLSAWREIARLTSGVMRESPLFDPIMAALEDADTAFQADDWSAFQRAAGRVRNVMESTSRREPCD